MLLFAKICRKGGAFASVIVCGPSVMLTRGIAALSTCTLFPDVSMSMTTSGPRVIAWATAPSPTCKALSPAAVTGGSVIAGATEVPSKVCCCAVFMFMFVSASGAVGEYLSFSLSDSFWVSFTK